MQDLPLFVSFGEALTDLIRGDAPEQWRSHSGGAPWNMALAMQRLGIASAFGGAISRDVFGQALLESSRAAGLDLRFLQCLDKPPLLAVVHQREPPRYFFIGEDSADLHFDPALLPAGWEQSLQWAHFGGISLAREPLAARLLGLAERLKAAGVRISYDPNFRRPPMDAAAYEPMLERMCRLADLIKVSDEDLLGLFDGVTPELCLARIRALNPLALLLHSRGAAGARLLLPDGLWQAAVPPITLVDSVGAGDAATAGLLSSLMLRPQAGPAQHLAWAVAGGAAACTRAGASPPSRAALEALAERVLPQPLDQKR